MEGNKSKGGVVEVKKEMHLEREAVSLGHSVRTCLILNRIAHRRHVTLGPQEMFWPRQTCMVWFFHIYGGGVECGFNCWGVRGPGLELSSF